MLLTDGATLQVWGQGEAHSPAEGTLLVPPSLE